MLNCKFDIKMELHLWKLDWLRVPLPQRERCLGILDSLKLTDTNLGGDVLYIIFLAAVFIENISSIIADYLFPLLCHLLSCPSISDRRCAVQAGLKKMLGGRWKDGNVLNWCHHWRQRARKLQPHFWRISWSVGGVEIPEICCLFWLLFFLPRVLGLCGRIGLWIAESCFFFYVFFLHHSETVNICLISVSICVTHL